MSDGRAGEAYYRVLYASPDAVTRAGWRFRAEQALRFEAALEGAGAALEAGVFDVGCGPGGLWCYLQDTGRAVPYLGVDRLEVAVEAARARAPEGRFVVGAPGRRGAGDVAWPCVVALGAAVDGEARYSQLMQREHVENFVDVLASWASRYLCFNVLNRDVVDQRPGMAMERAMLVAVSRDELEAIARRVLGAGAVEGAGAWSWVIRGDVLETDLFLYAWRGEVGWSPGEPWATQRRVLDGPWGAPEGSLERARLWMEAGAVALAREALACEALAHDAQAALMRELLAGM